MSRARLRARYRLRTRYAVASAGGALLGWLVTSAVICVWETGADDDGRVLAPAMLWGALLPAALIAAAVAAALGAVTCPRWSIPLRAFVVAGGVTAALIVMALVVGGTQAVAWTYVLLGISFAPLWFFLGALACLAWARDQRGSTNATRPG